MDQRRPPRKGGNAPAPRGPRPADRPRGRRTGHPTPKATDEGADRLQKVLAHAGVGSRRACEELILKGRISINGKVVRELGTKVDIRKATVAVDGEKVEIERPVYYAVYKPKGYVSTNNDPSGRPRVLDLLPEIPQRVYTVGRLDEMSNGLIILTNDGNLAHKLAHPKYGVEKLYRVVVAGLPEKEVLDKITEGIWLAEGKVRAKRVRAIGRRGESTILEMVLSEGKNREVRRMLAKMGHKVMSLTRIAVGPISIKGLTPGQWRSLTSFEVNQLRKTAAGEFVAPFKHAPKGLQRTDRSRPPAPLAGPSGRPQVLRPAGPASRPAGPPQRPSGPVGRPMSPGPGGRPSGPGDRPAGPPRRPEATPERRPGVGAFRPGGRPPIGDGPPPRPRRPPGRRGDDRERLIPPTGEGLRPPPRGRRVIGLEVQAEPSPRPRPAGKRPAPRPKPPRRPPGPIKPRRRRRDGE